MFRPPMGGRLSLPQAARADSARAPVLSADALRSAFLGMVGAAALVGFILAIVLLTVRATHTGRIFPALSVADVPVGGLSYGAAAAAILERADAIESSAITATRGDRSWTSTLREVGVSVDENEAFARAVRYGREESALRRLRSTAGLVRTGEQIALPITLDHQQLDRWFDQIDGDLGAPPRNAAVEVQGANVTIVPEVDGTVVDRARARAAIEAKLRNLTAIEIELPVSTEIATVRAVDLEPAREMVLRAMSTPIQVASEGGVWTLPGTDVAQFLTQGVDQSKDGAPAVRLGLDRDALAAWLDERLAAAMDREPVDAEVGWNGERLVSVVPSVDGVHLDAAKLAELVEGRFFGDGGTVEAPLTYIKPKIDSGNLEALGITTLLGTGGSNYAGSNDGRATNVAIGATLLNGTLIPPWGEFSFNGAIGVINEEKGFVEAQVIAGEAIGRDIGGGICQVSTTVFRAAYLAGLPIGEWWPHRFRIGFYEYDGWEPGLDASILQPTEDPSTWADFTFKNPSDSWMLVESWADGVNVVVNIYGADLGYQVESIGPTWGEKFQMLPPKEVVDEELEPGTVTMAQTGAIGEELTQYRVVRDRNGELLWEYSFYTKYFPRGEIWSVSPDMKGDAPIDPNFKFPPLPPAGVDSVGWAPGAEIDSGGTSPASAEEWTPDGAWVDPTQEGAESAQAWVEPAQAWTPPAEEWVPPADEAVYG